MLRQEPVIHCRITQLSCIGMITTYGRVLFRSVRLLCTNIFHTPRQKFLDNLYAKKVHDDLETSGIIKSSDCRVRDASTTLAVSRYRAFTFAL